MNEKYIWAAIGFGIGYFVAKSMTPAAATQTPPRT